MRTFAHVTFLSLVLSFGIAWAGESPPSAEQAKSKVSEYPITEVCVNCIPVCLWCGDPAKGCVPDAHYPMSKCPAGSRSAKHSIIDNIMLSYFRGTVDFDADGLGLGGGCTPCGGGSATGPESTRLPRLTIQRLHHPESTRHSSFGPGVFWQFDTYLWVYRNVPGRGDVISMYDPSSQRPEWQFDLSGDAYVVSNRALRDCRLFDATQTQVTSLDLAKTAEVRLNDGSSFVFEFITPTLARLTAQRDRNQNALTVTYQVPVTATPTTWNNIEKFKINTVVDAYGRTATVHYATATVGGAYAISRIDLPNGQHLDYAYNDPSLTGLCRVTYPDGTASTFSQTADAASQTVIYHIVDAMAEATHRIKDVYLSTPTYTDVNGTVQNRSANRVRMVVSGTGEVDYLAWQEFDPAVVQHAWTYVYEGGSYIYRYESNHGGPKSFARALTWDLSQPMSTWTWETRFTYQSDGRLRLTKETDALNRSTSYTMDDATHRITKETRADGTFDTATFTSTGQPLQQVDSLGRTTVCTYEGADNLKTRTVAFGTADAATWSYVYNARGQLIEERDPLYLETAPDLHVTTYGYNAAGYLTTISEAADVANGLRATRTFVIDASGRVGSSLDPANRSTLFQYDANNRLEKTTYADTSYELTTYGTGTKANLVVARRDRNGNITAIDYDDAGRTITTTVAAGTPAAVTESCTYVSGTTLKASCTKAGETTTFVYDHAQRLVSTTVRPRSDVTLTSTTTWDGMDRRVVSTDPYGRRTFPVYDAVDRVTRVVRELVVGGYTGATTQAALAAAARPTSANPAFIVEDTQYDVAGQVTRRSDAGGTIAEFAYNARGELTAQTDAIGSNVVATTQFGYDVAGNRIRVTSPRGIVTEMAYTGRNLLWTVTEAVGTTVQATTRTVTYSSTRKPLTEKDALNRITRYTYGVCCDRLKEIEDPSHFITSFAYDFVGNRTLVTDPLTHAVATAYDARNRVSSVTNAVLESTVFTYDENLTDNAGIDAVSPVAAVLPTLHLGVGANGSAVAVTDPLQKTSYELRDGLGRTVARIDALGHATTVAYDTLAGDLVQTSQTDALGHVTRVRSDAAGRARQQVDAQNNVSTASFDPTGNQVTQRDALQIGWNAIYDARHRLMQRTSTRVDAASYTAWTYDLDGNRLTETDALTTTETSQYDARNRRTVLTDRVNGVTRFGYDLVGNLVSISDADNEGASGGPQATGTTQYAYDARDLLIAEAFPTGQQGRTLRVYGYDGARRLTSRQVGIIDGTFTATPAFTGVSTTTIYGYDNANRLITRGYPDGANDAFGYDTAGRLTSADSSRYANTVRRAYDAAGRLTSERLAIDGQSYPVGYAYLEDNSLLRLTYPQTGSVVDRSYTVRHELAGVTLGNASNSRNYDAAGRLTNQQSGGLAALTETRGYVDGDYLVASIAVPGITSFAYTYDAAGRKLSETGQTFGYDNAGRLVSWTAGADTQDWNLTKVGDWASTTRNGVEETRVHQSVHEATSLTVGGTTTALTYDAQGNLTRDEQGRLLAWDPENRLVSAAVEGGAGYRYDALGRRVAKTVGELTTYYLPAGAQTVVELDRVGVRSQAEQTGATADGTLANLAASPVGGSILTPPGADAVTRVNFQPAGAIIPDGFVADTGKTLATRTNGLSYGWSSDRSASGVHHPNAVPRPAWTTAIRMEGASWSITLPTGRYAVAVVAGDALDTNLTNNLVIGTAPVTDGSPATEPAYEAGNFDGYLQVIEIGAGGAVSIAPGVGALNPTLCLTEIVAIPAGLADEATWLAAQQASLAAAVDAMNTATMTPGTSSDEVREYAYGSYIDEVVVYSQTVGGVTKRYYPHYNSLYSVAALTDSAGAVVERFTYDAYGKQKITDASGNVTRAKSSVGWDRGFTGYITDNETGLLHARARQYSPTLGRFLARDPWMALPIERNGEVLQRRATAEDERLVWGPVARDGYHDGTNLYFAYFIPNTVDFTGMAVPWPYVPLAGTAGCGVHAGVIHLGTDAQCVCLGAGVTPWDNEVRGCLDAAARLGVPPGTAHLTCYEEATKIHGVVAAAASINFIRVNLRYCRVSRWCVFLGRYFSL